MQNYLNPLFLVPSLTGIIFIIGAFISAKYPPKKINRMYGYRTKRSMKSNDRWDFAQKYSNDLMYKIGGASIILSFVGYFTSFSPTTSTLIAVGIMILLLLALIYKTENAIKEKFGDI